MNYGNMTLKEKILQTFVVTIREVNKHGGPESFFEKFPVGGMYYDESSDVNIRDKIETGTASCPEHLELCRKNSKVPLLICADTAKLSGQHIIAKSKSAAGTRRNLDAYNLGKIIGMQMNSCGIDWVLEPIVDMYYDRSMPLYAASNDPILTASLSRQIVKGIQDQGVCATVKHFPGLGTTNINMHFAPGQNCLSFNEWMKTYGYVYKEAFKENVCSVMTTHVTLKSYDNEYNNGFYPSATFSKKLTTDLLKETLGFDGVVVTDALIMGGMATGDIVKETVQAFKAGADMLLWPPIEAADAIAEAIENGNIPMSRLDDALMRIDKMRYFRKDALNKKIADKPDSEFANRVSEQIIRDGICLCRNDNNLIPIHNCKKILIIDATDNDKSAYMLCDKFVRRGFETDVKRIIYDVPSRVCWQDDIDELQSKYDVVILNLNTDIACTWSEPFMLIWASHLFDKKKKIIVNYGSPFFAEDYFPEDPTIIETNASPSDELANALAEGIIGEMDFKGHSVIL